MSKEGNVVKYYILCNKLKDVIRTGWKTWNVNRERLESVAEHIFGTQMLAIAMKSEFGYDEINIEKVLYMIAIHELGEVIIGDKTQFQISREEHQKIEHPAVHEILKNLKSGDEIEKLFLEFDSHGTPEAKFAYLCDKLECDLQCKLYDLEKCVDLEKQNGNAALKNELVKKLLEDGESWSNMWLKFDQQKYPFDENFMAVSNYLMEFSNYMLNSNLES